MTAPGTGPLSSHRTYTLRAIFGPRPSERVTLQAICGKKIAFRYPGYSFSFPHMGSPIAGVPDSFEGRPIYTVLSGAEGGVGDPKNP